MLNEFTSRPIFGFTLCVIAYHIGVKTKAKFNYPIVNPMIIASLICIGILVAFQIPLENFMTGANIIAMFLAPTTAVLALSVYRQLSIIKENLLPIIVGCVTGTLSSFASIIFLCRALGMTDVITASLIPKSVTASIAGEISLQLGGVFPITFAAVVVTGLFGAIMSPYFIKWSRLENPIASGLAIGASSHALGTTKAVELGEVEGALSSIAVGLCGLIAVLFSIFL